MFDWWNTFLADVKAWFNKSWSIFIARLEVFTGFLVGVLGGIDWTALTNLNWQDAIYNKNNLIVSAMLIIKGIVSEIARRAGTVTTVSDQLVPVNIAEAKKLKTK